MKQLTGSQPVQRIGALLLKFGVIGALSLSIAGCATQLGSMFGGGDKSEVTGSIDRPLETRERSLAMAANDINSAAPASSTNGACPRISVWRGDSQLTIYEIGRVGDNMAIKHRGEITKTARECTIGGGQVTVKYGIAGRVLLGPLGHSGTVNLPILVHVTDSTRQKIKTSKLNVKVVLNENKPYGDFSKVQRVSFPVPQGVPANDYNLFVTFDRNAPGAG